MTGAILSGLLESGVDPATVTTTNRSASAAAALAPLGVTALSEQADPRANRVAVSDAGVVLVGVKPYQVVEVLTSVADALRPDALIVSVAAGITTAAMEAVVPVGVRVIRAMPNTPATVGKAVTGLAVGSRATPQDLAVATALFESVGSVVVVDEDGIDALGTISGSGPAYFFFVVEQLISAAEARGFSAEQARDLVQGTFIGAAALLESSGLDPAELRRRVTSPGGSTAEAIAVMQAARLDTTFDEATAAALVRTKQMAAGA